MFELGGGKESVGVLGNWWKKASDANQFRKSSDSPNKIQKQKKEKKCYGEKTSKLLVYFDKPADMKLWNV